jgi:site-specific DNA-cytosine methylase
MLRIVDLFSGLHSWTRPLKYIKDHENFRLFSCDNNESYAKNTTKICDILDLTADEVIESLGGKPDIILASPPCTTFSIASCGHHWTGGFRAYIPKTEEAYIGLKLLMKTLQLIKELSKESTIYFIENPRGLMRKMGCMADLPRQTIWYCQYGETEGILRAKPTDIWTNSESWEGRPVCKNHTFEDGVRTSTHCDHVSARRGAKTGTQGLKNNALRSEIPYELCNEILMSAIHETYMLRGDE